MFTFRNLLHKIIVLEAVQVLEKIDNNFEAQASLGLISSFEIFFYVFFVFFQFQSFLFGWNNGKEMDIE